jgi:hypothetical protein
MPSLQKICTSDGQAMVQVSNLFLCLWASISVSSAGSWIATQLFYSPHFFNKTAMAATPQDLSDFVVTYMESYAKVYNPIQDLFERGGKSSVAQVLARHELSISLFFEIMLGIATNDYNDPGFPDRSASHENRVTGLSTTDLYLASALHPNTRLNNGFGLFQDSVTYIGPSDSETVYT